MICKRIRSYKRYLEALLTLLLIFVIFTTLNFGKGTYGNGAAEKGSLHLRLAKRLQPAVKEMNRTKKLKCSQSCYSEIAYRSSTPCQLFRDMSHWLASDGEMRRADASIPYLLPILQPCCCIDLITQYNGILDSKCDGFMPHGAREILPNEKLLEVRPRHTHHNRTRNLPRVSQYRDDVDLPGTGINNSRYYLQARRSYPRIVIYNRVPKCGSSTLRFLIGKLRIKNHFNYEVHNWPNVKQSLTSKEEKELVKQVTLLRRPVLFLRHLHHVNFKKYNLTTFPVYFNMIRHPVDRFISHFYFSRYGFQGWDESKIKTWLWPMPQEQRNMTLEDCVDQGVDKCITQNRENLIAFFCGQESRCRTRDDWSVKQAISNIKRDFAFVGILERLEDSMKIAEALLPRYFSGAAEFLRNHPEGGKKTKTANKKEPTQRVRKLLEQGMKPEMELYSFVKKRFTEQFQILKSKGKIY